MRPEDWLGWGASALLIVTLLHQIRTQLRSRDTKAVSPWLFAGQSAASVGFICYSAMLDNLVFIVTNSLILATAVFGQAALWWRARRGNA
jgi:MtN3 and saliva related transmembrane protein